MKGRGGGNGAGPTDLLVCFPSRAHLALMPKPICSPSRPSMAEPGKRHLRHPARPTITTAAAARGHPSPSPLFAASAKHGRTPGVDDEPTSPKVTCAGQIKVGRPKPTPKPRPTRTWLSVVEEIERLRADPTATRRKKKPTWLEAIGLKKDAWQFLGALRGVHFNFGCFGSIRGATECSTDDDEEDDEADDDDDDDDVVEEEKHGGGDGDGDGDGDGESRSETRTVFSKWFMVLEQNQGLGFKKEEQEELQVDEEDEKEEEEEEEEGEEEEDGREPPPPNALLLMRCRSAPAKGLLSRRQREETGDAEAEKAAEEEDEDEEVSATKMIKEDEKEKERLVLMSYAPDFFKVSMDIAKETWVVGSADPFARSRSCKR